MLGVPNSFYFSKFVYSLNGLNVFFYHRVTDKVVTKLLYKCRPYLIHLNMRGCQFVTEPSFTSISECSNLQDLNFSECMGLNVSTSCHSFFTKAIKLSLIIAGLYMNKSGTSETC